MAPMSARVAKEQLKYREYDSTLYATRHFLLCNKWYWPLYSFVHTLDSHLIE